MTDRRPPPRRTAELLHDLSLAAGFGGSLMGAVGLRGARPDITTEHDRIQALSNGWARWSVIAIPAVAAYAIGSGIDWRARRTRMGTTAWSAELGLVSAAAALSGYGAAVGSQIAADTELPYTETDHPPAHTYEQLPAVKNRLRVAQWLIPALTGSALAVSVWTRRS